MAAHIGTQSPFTGYKKSPAPCLPPRGQGSARASWRRGSPLRGAANSGIGGPHAMCRLLGTFAPQRGMPFSAFLNATVRCRGAGSQLAHLAPLGPWRGGANSAAGSAGSAQRDGHCDSHPATRFATNEVAPPPRPLARTTRTRSFASPGGMLRRVRNGQWLQPAAANRLFATRG